MKRLTLIIIGVLLCTPLYSDMNPYIAGVPVSGGGDSDIIFYFNCDSATSGQTPQKGSGTVTINANFSASTGQVGNALVTSSGWSRIQIPTSGNIDLGCGTIGFYWSADAVGMTSLMNVTGDTAPRFVLAMISATNMRWKYAGSYQDVMSNTAAETVYFIEVAWDYDNTRMAFRVDGGDWTEITNVTGNEPTGNTLSFGHYNGIYHTNGAWDQLLISSVYKKDLYSVRNNTSF